MAEKAKPETQTEPENKVPPRKVDELLRDTLTKAYKKLPREDWRRSEKKSQDA